MTIREQSKLSLPGYMFKVTGPGMLAAIIGSAKDAWPFIYNLLLLPVWPVFLISSAIYCRRKDRQLVEREANRRAQNGKN